MAVTQLSSLNSLFNTIYDRALFVAREMNLMVGLVDNRSATGWMNRNVSIRPQITAVTVAETQDFAAPTTFGKTTQATITPGEVMAQVVLTDRDRETDPDGAQRDAELELGASVATKIDVDLASVFGSFGTDKGDGAGNAATISNFAAAVAVLRFNQALQYGVPSAVWHPYHWHDLWVELGQPAATYDFLDDMANEAMRNYYVSDWLKCRHFTSSNIAIDGSDDAVSGLFVRPAIMLDTRRPIRMEPERDASARAWELNVNAGYGYGITRDTLGVGFTADATEPA